MAAPIQRQDKIMPETSTDVPDPFAPGTLWGAIVERGRAARASGALQPIATESRAVDDHGVRFQVRVVSSLARKLALGLAQWQAPGTKTAADPFLPYERDLFVADVSPTHVCLLNKYNVIDNHALVVTRAFESQENLLTLEDFAALWSCMAEFDALGFYNSGPIAGASQPHKHLQLVPLPLSAGVSDVPIEVLLDGQVPAAALRADRLPFTHAFARLNRVAAATDVHSTYKAMLAATGIDAGAAPRPYNLLLTRRFMLLIPRRQLQFEGISVNALGFAGSFFVADSNSLEVIERTGPMEILTQVAFSR